MGGESVLDHHAADKVANLDANALLYTAKACQLFSIGRQENMPDAVRKIQARVLTMPADSDFLLLPHHAQKAAEILRCCGKEVEYAALKGDGGHFDGLLAIEQGDAMLRKFLGN